MGLRYTVISSPRENNSASSRAAHRALFGTHQVHCGDPGPLSSQEGQLNTGKACYGGKQMIWL